MSGTEELIEQLSSDLAPVRRLPALRNVAAVVFLGALVAIVLTSLWWVSQGHPLIKPDLRSVDVLGFVGHLVLGLGALALALGECVPGRDPLVKRAAGAAGIGGLVTLAAIVVVLATGALSTLGEAFVAETVACTLLAAIPALVPAALVTAFATRGAPHRPMRALLFGAISAAALGALPGHVACANPYTLHTLLGHMLVPLIGGAVIGAGMRLAYRPALPPIRR